MSTTQPTTHLIKKLWHHIGPRRRVQFGGLLLLMILASFAEVLSIGAVLPFLGVLTAPDKVFTHPLAQPFVQILGFAKPDELLMPLTAVFCFAAIVAGAMRLLMLWACTRISYATGADLSIGIYRRTLYQPYSVHVARNSSEIISGITGKTNGLIYAIVMSLTLVSSFILLVSILLALLAVDPKVALTAFVGFALLYALIIRLVRRRLNNNSHRIAHESTQRIKSLQEGLGGIRDVLVDGSQAVYCEIYRNADYPLRRAEGSSAFISASPRYAMEAMGMVLIASLALSLAQQPEGLTKTIPILGALALGAQRLLPILQQAYMAWSSIESAKASIEDALSLLDQPLPDHADQTPEKPLSFDNQIRLEGLSFRYSAESPWVIKNVDLSIDKGVRVGFIGTSGSGKSTLLDIVMGLLQPSEGSFAIDGREVDYRNQRAWQAHIAHVPQAIFLADTTIEENIAFGVPREQIDHERIRVAARNAQIAEVIESWPQQYKTIVGERGVRLSGGQRQRIGIARALYKQADVIIFDEATSALDNETEQAVMQAIEGLSTDLTILIIAHRLTTLRNCTQVIELGDGGIRRIGNYRDMVAQAA